MERHYAKIDSFKRRIKLILNGKIIVDSTSAFILKEVGTSVYDPVYYFPKSDVLAELVSEEDRTSHCPIKGAASYWNLKENPIIDNYFAWSYEHPLPRSKKIAGYVAFNMDYLTFVSEPI